MTAEAMGRLGAVAAERWGLVTVHQANAVGVPTDTLARWARAGALARVAWGVYRMAGAPELEHESIYATWLALGGASRAEVRQGVPALVAAGVTATVVHGIGDFWPGPGDFIVPRRRATRLQARLRVRHLEPDEVTTREGMPVLTVERTVADLLELWTDRSLVADVIASAAAQGRLLRPTALVEYLAPLAARAGYMRGDGRRFAMDVLKLAGLDAAAAQVREAPPIGAPKHGQVVVESDTHRLGPLLREDAAGNTPGTRGAVSVRT